MRSFLLTAFLSSVLLIPGGARAGSTTPPNFTNTLENDAPRDVAPGTLVTLTWSAYAAYCSPAGSSFPNNVHFDDWNTTGSCATGNFSTCSELHTGRYTLVQKGTYRFNVKCGIPGHPEIQTTSLINVVDTPKIDGISLSLSASTPGPVRVGDTYGYLIGVRNLGTNRMTSLRVSVPIPNTLTVTANTCNASVSQGTLVWSGPDIATGSAASCTFSVRAGAIPANETIQVGATANFNLVSQPFTLTTREVISSTHRSRPQTVTRSGTATTANSGTPQLTANGKLMVYSTLQKGIGDNDSNTGGADILLKDHRSGLTRVVSLNPGGAPLQGNSITPAISGNGQALAFIYRPPGTTSVKRRMAAQGAEPTAGENEGQICSAPPNGLFQSTCTSTNSSGQNLDGAAESPSLSADGKLMAFASSATNWVAGDTNNAKDVFVKNLETGQVTLVSTDAAGVQGQGASIDPMISGNGRFVLFRTQAANLGGTADWQVVRKDLGTGALLRMSQNSVGTPANGEVGRGTISWDGQRIAFASRATNLALGFNGGLRQVYVYNERPASSARRAPGGAAAQVAPQELAVGLFGVRDNAGGVPDGNADDPAISCSGRTIAFASTATDLISGDLAGMKDVFAVDADTGVARRAVAGGGSAEPNAASSEPAIDCEGTTSAFASQANNLDNNDPNPNNDIYLQQDPQRSGVPSLMIDQSFSGNWYNAGQSGHGFLLEALPSGEFYVTWYLYVSGQPLFLQGIARPQGNVIDVQVYQSRSTAFPVGAGGATSNSWGRIKLTFTGSTSASAEWTPTVFGYSAGSMVLQRLTTPALIQSDVSGGLRACYSGVWYEAARPGYGFDIEVNDFDDGKRYLTVYWYTYKPNGDPLWLVGVGAMANNAVAMDLYQGSGPGAQFPPDFVAGSVTASKWGTASFSFFGSNLMNVAYQPTTSGYASGNVTVQRITTLRGRECGQ
ncbi:hypothetical protein [Tahibacter amnicola]|uniref:DUF11 domain-containing protein n=1 Tax=Tahibacter amnicola TaxID=2976241 RepID=A0ABY6BLC2_9GAMM|nr:hypothetical protein [Tahibacter amnicola]UXI69371.1 hypothetical protein N4264_06905 [Tahibacter amnicola]